MNKTSMKNATITPDVVIHAHHAILTDKFKSHASEKLLRIERFALPIRRVDVEVSHEANPRQSDRAFHIELTCDGKGPFVRAEAAAADQYTALDLAVERLEEQLRRLHERSKSISHRRPNPILREFLPREKATLEVLPDPDVLIENGPFRVELKHPELKDLSIEEAVEQMELSGHYFFMFRNIENGITSILYRKHGYDYGLVQVA